MNKIINKWQVLCNREALEARSHLYQIIRQFFHNKNILEVETPLLSLSTVTDPFIQSFEIEYSPKLYLQTSPEFAMKRMLASGIGSIFQICKAFRVDEIGKNHNIEFTMLEWYRTGFVLNDLMQEVEELLLFIINFFYKKNTSENYQKNIQIDKYTYQELFLQYLSFDYSCVDTEFLKNKIHELFKNQFDNVLYHKDFDKLYDKDDLLMILLSNYIEPKLNKENLTFIYNYPNTQSALSKVEVVDTISVAKRFEVYYKGVELANGYDELDDHKEQESRFNKDLARRKKLGLVPINTDQNFLASLKSGLPQCSGVAMGLDRLLMVLLGVDDIEQVIPFRL